MPRCGKFVFYWAGSRRALVASSSTDGRWYWPACSRRVLRFWLATGNGKARNRAAVLYLIRRKNTPALTRSSARLCVARHVMQITGDEIPSHIRRRDTELVSRFFGKVENETQSKFRFYRCWFRVHSGSCSEKRNPRSAWQGLQELIGGVSPQLQIFSNNEIGARAHA